MQLTKTREIKIHSWKKFEHSITYHNEENNVEQILLYYKELGVIAALLTNY